MNLNISQVVDKLQKIKNEHGELPVFVCADHGQINFTAYSVDVCYIDDDNESIHPDDLDDYDLDDLTKVAVIDG